MNDSTKRCKVLCQTSLMSKKATVKKFIALCPVSGKELWKQ